MREGEGGWWCRLWETLTYLKQEKTTHLQQTRCCPAQEPLWAGVSPINVQTKGLKGLHLHALNTHSLQVVGGFYHQILFCRRAWCYHFFPSYLILTYPSWKPRRLWAMGGDFRHSWRGNRSHPSLQIWQYSQTIKQSLLATLQLRFCKGTVHPPTSSCGNALRWWTILQSLTPLDVFAPCLSVIAVIPACLGSPEPLTPISLLEKCLPQPDSEWFIITSMELGMAIKSTETLRKQRAYSEMMACVAVSYQQHREPREVYTCFGDTPFLICWCLMAVNIKLMLRKLWVLTLPLAFIISIVLLGMLWSSYMRLMRQTTIQPGWL